MKVSGFAHVYLSLDGLSKGQFVFMPCRHEPQIEDLIGYKYLGKAEVSSVMAIDLDGLDFEAEAQACRERYKQYQEEQAA